MRLAVLAVRLRNPKLLARAQPAEPVEVKRFGAAAIKLVEKRSETPARDTGPIGAGASCLPVRVPPPH